MPRTSARTSHSLWSTLAFAGASLMLGACSATRPPPAQAAPEAKKQDSHNDQRAFIAHEFFLRARQQEMEGNDAVARPARQFKKQLPKFNVPKADRHFLPACRSQDFAVW